MNNVKYEKQWIKVLEEVKIEMMLPKIKTIVAQVVILPGSPELLHNGLSVWWEIIIDDLILLRFKSGDLVEIESKNKFFYVGNPQESFAEMHKICADYERMFSLAQFFEERSHEICTKLLEFLPEYLEERDTKQKRRNNPFQAKITCSTCHTCEFGVSLILSSTATCAACA
jgi:hypothetical protein